jgi:phosphopantothenoylcysteine decarboxylase / phosphopantothenate---cysteine ligase
MGFAIAEAALKAGHEVTLISGRVNFEPPAGAKFVSVTTSDDMYRAVHAHIAGCDVLVMCAAVADYRPAQYSEHKIKKGSGRVTLELTPTRDILASLPRDRKFLVIGFAAETNDVEKHARKKLQDKKLDLIVANDVSRPDVGMESADNEVTILFSDGKTETIARTSKKIIAYELVKIISNLKKNV